MRKLVFILSLIVLFSSGCNMFGKKKREEQARIEAQRKKDSIANAQQKAKDLKLKKQRKSRQKKKQLERLKKRDVNYISFM